MTRAASLEIGGWRVTHRGGRVYLTDNHADADPGMPPAVAQRLAVELFLASDRATWDEGESPGPAQVNAAPAGPGAATSVPTLDQIKRVRRPEDADRLIRQAGEEFGELVFQAVLAMRSTVLRTRDQAREWWVLASVKDRRDVLEYAVELAEQQQHETSAVGSVPPPAADPQSDPAPGTKGKGVGPGSDDPVGGDVVAGD